MNRRIAFPVIALALAAACGVGEGPVAADVVLHRMAKSIDQISDEEVMHCRAGRPYAATQAGDQTHDFGNNLYGLTTEPGWAVGWAMLVAQEEEEEEKPKKCRGKGIKFAKCVKGHVDAGLTCTVWKEDDEYVASCVLE